MNKALSVSNLLSKKPKTMPFQGIWKETMGTPEPNGPWLIYGAEKNGKTWFAIKLADYLSSFGKVLYVSAEEGLSDNFKEVCIRAGIEAKNKGLQFLEDIELEDLSVKIEAKRSPKVVIIDNITMYAEDLRGDKIKNFIKRHKDKLIIFIAHEEKNEPIPAPARLCRRLAKVIVRVQGLACFVSGRCPGGTLIIDEEKAMLYHGTEIAHE